jgi:hypothetical protein
MMMVPLIVLSRPQKLLHTVFPNTVGDIEEARKCFALSGQQLDQVRRPP